MTEVVRDLNDVLDENRPHHRGPRLELCNSLLHNWTRLYSSCYVPMRYGEPTTRRLAIPERETGPRRGDGEAHARCRFAGALGQGVLVGCGARRSARCDAQAVAVQDARRDPERSTARRVSALLPHRRDPAPGRRASIRGACDLEGRRPSAARRRLPAPHRQSRGRRLLARFQELTAWAVGGKSFIQVEKNSFVVAQV